MDGGGRTHFHHTPICITKRAAADHKRSMAHGSTHFMLMVSGAPRHMPQRGTFRASTG
ncbi:hypothetical protein [Azospirillum endophyticum]